MPAFLGAFIGVAPEDRLDVFVIESKMFGSTLRAKYSSELRDFE
jgi:hypothetical protein